MRRIKINKKGFTLIEMLGAVAILGIIATIGIVSVSKVIKSAHNKFDNTQYDSFMQAAETYFSDNKSRLPLTPMDWKEITLQELINKKYIEKMLDSNKQEFDYARSKVVVTRLTSGKYKYEAILYRKKGSPIGKISNKVTNQNSNITFRLRDKNKYHKENKTYYVRDYPVVDIGISDTDQLSGYQYIIYRNGKQFKKSENIEISGGLSVKEAVTLGKEFPFGKYSIKVVAYDKSGNKTTNSTDNSGLGDDAFSIYIDRIKPNCAIQIDGKIGDNGWYKEKDISLTLKESDKESGLLKHDMQTSKSFTSLGTLNTLTTLVKKQSDTGGTTWYAHVEDKAGNVCETEVSVKVDTKKPRCAIVTNTTPPEPIDSSKWYNLSMKGKIEPIKISRVDEGPSGISKYIIDRENTTLKANYKNLENQEEIETLEGEYHYNGYVRDMAGNDIECSALLRKDTIPPDCNTAGRPVIFNVGSGPAGYSPLVTFSTTIQDSTVVRANLSFMVFGHSLGDVCNATSNARFEPLTVGRVLMAEMQPCLGFTGDVLVSYDYFDRAGNATFCETERVTLEPVKKRGCTDPSASNYDSTAEENDGSCYYPPPPAPPEEPDPIEPEEPEEEEPDPSDPEALSCSKDIEISYSNLSSTVNFKNHDWTKGPISITIKIKNKDKIDHWDWWTNESGRLPSEGTGEFDGCLNGSSCNYTNNSSNTSDEEKKYSAEGVRKGVIMLYGKDGQTPKKCPAKTYYIDTSPPQIDATCRFNNADAGFSCTGEDGPKHLYHGVFVRVKDTYVGIDPSEYTLKGYPSSRSGDSSTKTDRYCISSGGSKVDEYDMLNYKLCDILGNCERVSVDVSTVGYFGGITCEDMKDMHKCSKVSNSKYKYKCDDNGTKKCYDKDSQHVRC